MCCLSEFDIYILLYQKLNHIINFQSIVLIRNSLFAHFISLNMNGDIYES